MSLRCLRQCYAAMLLRCHYFVTVLWNYAITIPCVNYANMLVLYGCAIAILLRQCAAMVRVGARHILNTGIYD